MYSYDHDLEEFVAIGLGTVTEDSTTIRSNIGVGVVKAGWHCGSQPGGSGTAANCDTCYKCDGSTCVTDPAQAKNAKDPQIQENCKTETCDGVGVPNSGDAPKFDLLYGDCRTPGCDGGTRNMAKDVNNSDYRQDTAKGDCQKPGCENGTPKDVVDSTDYLEDTSKGDCKKPGCDGGTPEDKDDNGDITPEQTADCKECKEGNLEDKCDKYGETGSANNGVTYRCNGVLTQKVFPESFTTTALNSGEQAIAIQTACVTEHEQGHQDSPNLSCPTKACGVGPTSTLPPATPTNDPEHCPIWRKQINCYNAGVAACTTQACKDAMNILVSDYTSRANTASCP